MPAREFMEGALTLWKELDLPPLAVRSPWYGYSLGGWTDAWDEFARKAVDGAWAKNGDNSWARRRGGRTPETPTRIVEDRQDNHPPPA